MGSIYISEKFKRNMIKLRTSWQWVKTDFEAEFNELIAKHESLKNYSFAPIKTRPRNDVEFIALASGRKIVYKRYHKLRLKYSIHLTQTSREAYNYQELSNLEFPVAKILATGDKRNFFFPKSSFIVTEYADSFRNCMDFATGYEFNYNQKLKHTLYCKSLEILAKLHDQNIAHKDFHLGNIMWKAVGEDDLELLLIDVATCQKLPTFMLKKLIPKDFVGILSNFDLTSEERLNYIKIYCNSCKKPLFTPEELLPKVEKWIIKKQIARQKKEAKKRSILANRPQS